MAKKATTKKKKKVSATRKNTAVKLKKKIKNTVKKAATKSKVKRSKKVSPVPKGYSNITPYLIIEGASKAIEFYKDVFGAKQMMRMDQPNGKVGHAELKIGDAKFMVSDECPEMDSRGPGAYNGSPVTMYLYLKNVDHVVDHAVSLGAELLKPVQDMFYGDRCGALRDPFGHVWCVATHIEDVSPAVLKRRAAELFGNK
jgi:PhnB protein